MSKYLITYLRNNKRVALQVLPRCFLSALSAYQSSEQVFERASCSVGENAIFSVDIDPAIRANSSAKNCCVIRILRGQSLSEFSIIEMTISILIIALEKKMNVISSNMDPYVNQTVLHVCSRD